MSWFYSTPVFEVGDVISPNDKYKEMQDKYVKNHNHNYDNETILKIQC